MKIIWSPQARDDLEEIFNYLLEDNPSAALSVCERIEQQIKRLFGNCRENETGFNTPPNVFNDLAGQARGFCSRFHGNSQRADKRRAAARADTAHRDRGVQNHAALAVLAGKTSWSLIGEIAWVATYLGSPRTTYLERVA
jgi:hypothetical protein